ncbi:hypothetical protein ABPG74_012680 [Tetrahymena malaccensis]
MGQCCSDQGLPDLSAKTDLQKIQIYGPADCVILDNEQVQQKFNDEIKIQINLDEYKKKYLIEEKDNIQYQRVALPYLKLKCGLVYKGQWKNKKMDGYGQIIIPSSKVYYCGEFEQGIVQGSGIIIHSNGDIYEGNFKNFAADKYGEFKGVNGEQYKGQWQNDQKHGRGVYQDQLYKYEGDFERGIKQGQGTLEFYDVFKYKGSFQNNMFEGNGELEYLDGSKRKYIGEFNQNKKSGNGHFIWPLCEYKGQYQDDQRNGMGEIQFVEGIKVSGMFVNGQLNDDNAKIHIGDNEIQAKFTNGIIVSDNGGLSDQIKQLFILNDFDENIY